MSGLWKIRSKEYFDNSNKEIFKNLYPYYFKMCNRLAERSATKSKVLPGEMGAKPPDIPSNWSSNIKWR